MELLIIITIEAITKFITIIDFIIKVLINSKPPLKRSIIVVLLNLFNFTEHQLPLYLYFN